jgi:hypothetical protein
MSQSHVELKLTFSRKVCECGERERIVGMPCPSCGRRPSLHEFNRPVITRQRIAQEIRQIESRPTVTFSLAGVRIFSEVFHDMDRWIPRFMSCLNANRAGISEAKALTSHLFGLIDAFERVPRLRPWRGLYKNIEAALASIASVWAAVLDAYSASTPLEAQRQQREMQLNLDNAAIELSKWARSADRLGGIIGLRPERLLVDAADASLRLESQSQHACARMLRDLRSREDLLSGMMPALVVGIETATIVGETDEFIELVKTTVQALRNSRQKSSEMIRQQVFQENFARALDETYRSSGMIYALGIASGDERLAVDALVNAAHSIVESGTRHSMAVIAAIGDVFSYRSALAKGAAECIRRVRAGVYTRLADDLDLDVRDAKAHQAYRIDSDNGIEVLKDRGNVKKRISGSELVDLVVAGNILATAMSMAFLVFACEVGMDVSVMAGSIEMLPAIQVVQLLSITLGWPLVQVDFSEDNTVVCVAGTPEITIALPSAEAPSLLTAISIANLLPSAAETLIIDDGMSSPVSLSISDARAIGSGGEGFLSTLRWLRFFNSLRRGSDRLMGLEDWNLLIDTLCTQAIEGGGVGGLRKLLIVRNTLRNCGDEDCIVGVTQRIQTLRSQIAGD